jgi:putative heme iron utilization protein
MSEPAAFDPKRHARTLISEARIGSLATLDHFGAPYVSLVTVATLPDRSPLLLLSKLARHTQNFARDPRVSLLVSENGAGAPLEAARISIAGRIAVTEEKTATRRFLLRHPSAAGYAGFKDFAFYRIEPAGGHLVAGFGRIADVKGEDIKIETGDAAPLLEAEAGAVEHMNEDHLDAIELYATRLLGDRPGPWRVIGADPEGCDLMLDGRVRRLDFPQRVKTAGDLRKALVSLAQQARAA